jgi:hypothetical protein
MSNEPVGKNISAARLDDFRVLVIGGPDRVEFLQGQLTQDVTLLETAGTALAGWASAKGRLLAAGQLIAAGDEIWWPLPADIVDGVAKRLQIFVLRADVKIVISAMPVTGLFDVGGSDQLQIAGQTAPVGNRPSPLADGSLIVRVVGDSNRAWLIGPAAETTGFSPAGESAWVLQSIRTGLPFIVADTQELFVPQMVNLDWIGAISFDKGCYVGQEIVARTQNLGRIKRRMYRFTAGKSPVPRPGASIYGPEPATGKVVLSVANGEHSEMLAVVPIDTISGPWFCDESRSIELTSDSVPYDVNR